MKKYIPKIQWLDWDGDPEFTERSAQSLEGRFYITGFKGCGYHLEIREIRYGLKDQPNTVQIHKLYFKSMRAAKKFAQRRMDLITKCKFDQADLEVSDALA